MSTLHQIRRIAISAQGTLAQDAMGVAALTVMLVAALHLPHLI